MKKYLSIFLVLVSVEHFGNAEYDLAAKLNKTTGKHGKLIFSVVQFPNTACRGTGSRTGTCYTSYECDAKKGTSIGTCANSYGICCVFSLDCGESTSENCTYLVFDPSTATQPLTCTYNLCPTNPTICRFRLDFSSFDINGPQVGTTTGTVTAGVSPAALAGGSIGDCTIDSFVVTSAGNKGTPVICGFNTGQHLYVDTADTCSQAIFTFGRGSTYLRQYDIKVTEYICGDTLTGPNDCLQYFTGITGTVKSFNYRTTATGAVIAQTTHLSNQCYSICFRRNFRFCAICFSPTVIVAISTSATQNSFGLSLTDPTIPIKARSLVDSNCQTDYLIIPNAISNSAIAVIGLTDGVDRFCGRFFNTNPFQTTSETVCSGSRPFRVVFKTDADEVTLAGTTGETDEQAMSPGGIVGFSLNFWQIMCPQ